VAGASLSVPSAGYETKANWKKHEGSLSMVVSDVGSTPTASTNFSEHEHAKSNRPGLYFHPGLLLSASVLRVG